MGGVDRDLAAEAGIPGNGLDLYHAVIDFRHLDLKQAFKHVPVTARDEYLRALWGIPYADHVDLGALALAVPFSGYLFFIWKDGLSPSQVYHYGLAVFRLVNDA